MKMIATFCCLFIAAVSFAQTDENLVTTKSESHIHIPGTAVSLMVPGDYKLASDFDGFISRGKTAQVRVEENHNMGFDQRMATLESSLKKGGMKVVEFKDVTYNGYKAKFITTEAGQMIGSCILLFGDDNFYIQVGGTYQLSDKPAANSIRTAALSCVYEKTIQ